MNELKIGDKSDTHQPAFAQFGAGNFPKLIEELNLARGCSYRTRRVELSAPQNPVQVYLQCTSIFSISIYNQMRNSKEYMWNSFAQKSQ